VSPTAAFPVNTLSEIQALDELAAIMDARPGDEDPLEVIHWQQNNSYRAQQLEAHILHLQQNAPPQQLQPDPEPTVNPNEEKVQEALAELIDVTSKANLTHDWATFKTLQNRSANLRFKIRDKCRKYGIPEPELPEPPVNPFLVAPEAAPAPTARQREIQEENEYRQGTIQQMLDVQEPGLESPRLEKAGAGPYVPPTTASLLAAMERRSPCAEDCICPEHQRSAYPVAPAVHQMQAAPPTTQARAEQIRRSLTTLLADIDAMDDRQAIRPWLDAIEARIQMCYAVADELAEQAG